jgi:hypothetical protein
MVGQAVVGLKSTAAQPLQANPLTVLQKANAQALPAQVIHLAYQTMHAASIYPCVARY